MGIYDRRDKPAYENFNPKPEYCQNPHILKWWTPSHDLLLSEQIQKEQWTWYWGITDKLVAITPPHIIETWRERDPLCSRYAWYNILMYFAASRAEVLHLAKAIRKPQWRVCPLCSQSFVEDSLPMPLVRRLGIQLLDFCAPCLGETLFNPGHERLSKQAILTYLRELADALQRVPPQDFGSGMTDIVDLSTEERLTVLRLLKNRPSLRRVQRLFGSWLNALVNAGLVPEGGRRTVLGTQCLARDGHVCRSLAEKTVDDLLFSLRIPHEREAKYPESNLRADFVAHGVFIEYLGLTGDNSYDARTRLKQELCKKHAIRLILVHPRDLGSSKKLEEKLLAGLSLAQAR